jgi:hypothetical protein
MPAHPAVSAITALGGASVGTALSEGLKSPKAIALFYVEIAKSCYTATGSKRIACAVAAGACGFALVPGPHQAPFIAACAESLKGASKL